MIYAIGDVHGCCKTLKALMQKLPYEPDDLLVFMGDYIDRGPDSRGVLEYLIELLDRHRKLVYLRGNHEQMCLDALKGGQADDMALWVQNGASATLKSYDGHMDAGHVWMLDAMPLWYETEDYFFCHAGVDPRFSLDQQPKEALLWMREPFIESQQNFGKQVVFGHTVLKQVWVTANKIGIDTGCVYGRKLSAIALPDQHVFEEPCCDL